MVTVKFPCRKNGTSHVTEINGFYFSARTKSELGEQIAAFIETNLRDPEVGMVRNGEDIRITTFVGDRYTIHKTVGSDDGIVRVESTTIGCLMSKEKPANELEKQALHLAQCQWDQKDPTPPSWLPASKRSDWDAWVRFQVAYKIAIESGVVANEAHHLACQAMH